MQPYVQRRHALEWRRRPSRPGRPDGRIAAAFLFVDLGCLGVKWASGHPRLPLRAYRRHVDRLAEKSGGLEPCDPALAAAIVRAGFEYAASLGFDPDPDFAWVRGIFGDLEEAAWDEPIECGEDGKPLYVAGPEDDVQRILDQLQERLGPDGFHFVAPAGRLRGPEPGVQDELDELVDELSSTLPPEGGEALLLRCGRLKRLLVLLVQCEGMAPERRRFRDRLGLPGGAAQLEPDEVEDLLAAHTLPDARRVHDLAVCFVPGLSERDREILLGWKEPVLGVFEVQERRPDHLVCENLVDELCYCVRSNMGASFLDQVPVGSLSMGRLVPLDEGWLLSGDQAFVSPEAGVRDALLETAAQLAHGQPGLLFRNPALLERAWEIQRKDYARFVAHFGSDEVVLSGAELQAAMDGLLAANVERVAAEEGLTVEEMAAQDGVAPARSMVLPDALLASEDVGVLHDETWSLGFYDHYSLFRAAFADGGAGAEDEEAAEVVFGYLESPTIDPLPFLRVAGEDPAAASWVLGRLLDRPDFDWARDGEDLLRAYKGSWYPPRPRNSPMSREMLQALARLEARER